MREGVRGSSSLKTVSGSRQHRRKNFRHGPCNQRFFGMNWNDIFGLTLSPRDYRSITEAFILVGTIVGWNSLIDWLTFRSEWLQKVLEHGVSDPREVGKAYMEPDGQVTVLKKT